MIFRRNSYTVKVSVVEWQRQNHYARMTVLYTVQLCWLWPGTHNDVREEGKGRSMQRPRKRLKFENVLTVVPLLLLARASIASLTDDSTGKAAKIIVRHKMVSVRAEGYVS